ncbi:APC family permease [Paraflavisolibacter sp. H34]|uniref:APC family permease n=1 Tax=Huijunlia imazamoxiresistens TaxID=3127457 RepID=UPI003016F346
MKQLTNRKINLLQATALNMIDMVGIGPFVVIPLVIRYFDNGLFLWAWIFGAFVALVDSMIWSELGAAYPLAGGSYNFLNEAYGPRRGRVMSFLYVWQTSIQAPLVVASGAIGFAQYFSYLVPLGPYEAKAVSAGVILLLTFLLYRKIETVGKISVLLWIGVLVTIGWIIWGGITHRQVSYTPMPADSGDFFQKAFWFALGQGSVKTIYSYLGYYNVCHLGGEIKNPGKNIPRSIFISVICIAVLYLGMNISIAGVVPWQEAQQYDFIVSIFIERIYGQAAARFATGLVLWIAFASLFAVLLGYSRVPYAAAVDGNFFRIFARLHPTKAFPHISLLFLAGIGLLFSLLFKLKDVISAILAMRILVQFIAQAAGVVQLRKTRGTAHLPFKMWLYPLPVVVSVIVWLFVFFSTGKFALWGCVLALAGLGVYFLKGRVSK